MKSKFVWIALVFVVVMLNACGERGERSGGPTDSEPLLTTDTVDSDVNTDTDTGSDSETDSAGDRLDRVDEAISSGLAFLMGAQLESGELATQFCPTPLGSEDCFFDSSVFTTCWAVDSLASIEESGAEDMWSRAADFLEGEHDGGGLWSYNTEDNPMSFVPDIDDTACVSIVMEKFQKYFPDNTQALLDQKDEHGRLLTWFKEDKDAYNDVDCTANVNVLYYLKDIPELQSVCDFVNGVIEARSEKDHSPYYFEIMVFYYAVARALQAGVGCLEQSAADVASGIAGRLEEARVENAVHVIALGTTASINLGRGDIVTTQHIDALLEQQDADGGWPWTCVWVGPGAQFGSREMTTVLCVEALDRYRQMLR